MVSILSEADDYSFPSWSNTGAGLLQTDLLVGGGDGGGVCCKVVNTMNDKEKERKTKITENK